MTDEEIENLTDYQRQCFDAAQEASVLFFEAIRDLRNSIPDESYNGDAYVIGGCLASAFDPKDWDRAFVAFKDGWDTYVESHEEQDG